MKDVPYLRIDRVTKVYNPGRPDETTALHEVTLDIGRGQVTVLKGPSGSGKTSLLSVLGCMSRPTSGKVFVDTRDVVKLPERFLTDLRRRKFGFIFQQFHLIRNITVLENILLPLYPWDMKPRAMNERSLAVMNLFGLAGKKNMKVKNLSGGEQQRVAIARALINEPEVIIADEPTTHLDLQLAAEFMDILTEQSRAGKTIVIATHDPYVHEHPLVDCVVALRDGCIEGGA